MPDYPSKPPPPPRDPLGESLERMNQEPGPPIQADPISRYRPLEKLGWIVSDSCHILTLAAVLAILILLCVTTARDEGRYQKALRLRETFLEADEARTAAAGTSDYDAREKDADEIFEEMWKLGLRLPR